MAEQARSGCLRFEASAFTAPANKSVGCANLVMSELAGARAITGQKFSVQNNAAADARTERKQHEIFRILSGAEPELTEGRASRVVGNEDRQIELSTRSEEHT